MPYTSKCPAAQAAHVNPAARSTGLRRRVDAVRRGRRGAWRRCRPAIGGRLRLDVGTASPPTSGIARRRSSGLRRRRPSPRARGGRTPRRCSGRRRSSRRRGTCRARRAAGSRGTAPVRPGRSPAAREAARASSSHPSPPATSSGGTSGLVSRSDRWAAMSSPTRLRGSIVPRNAIQSARVSIACRSANAWTTVGGRHGGTRPVDTEVRPPCGAWPTGRSARSPTRSRRSARPSRGRRRRARRSRCGRTSASVAVRAGLAEERRVVQRDHRPAREARGNV